MVKKSRPRPHRCSSFPSASALFVKAALEVENKRLQLVARAAQDTAEQASSLRQDHDERQKSLENTIAELEAALAKERADLTRALLKV